MRATNLRRESACSSSRWMERFWQSFTSRTWIFLLTDHVQLNPPLDILSPETPGAVFVHLSQLFNLGQILLNVRTGSIIRCGTHQSNPQMSKQIPNTVKPRKPGFKRRASTCGKEKSFKLQQHTRFKQIPTYQVLKEDCRAKQKFV